MELQMSTNHWHGRVAAVALATLLVAACAPPTDDEGDAAPDAEEGAQDGQEDAQGEPDSVGGRLIVARTGDIDNLDPHLATAFQTYQTLELVYDTLFELTPE